jgi:hypothetical protein
MQPPRLTSLAQGDELSVIYGEQCYLSTVRIRTGYTSQAKQRIVLFMCAA